MNSEEVKDLLIKNDVKWILNAFTDIRGIFQSFSSPVTNYLEEDQYFKAGINWHGVALRGLFSQLNRVSFITEKESRVQKIYLELLIVKIRASQPETSYSLSQSAFFDWLLMIGRSIIDDNVKGRKAQLLKRISKSTAVEVSQRTSKGEDRMIWHNRGLMFR